MEDRVKLTADDSDYQRVMQRAGNTADKFTSRINHASNGFTNLFKRSPNLRAERALSGFFERAASGDIVGAISQISGRMTGLGIVAGVAIGAGVEIFQKFVESVKATDAASGKLYNTLAGIGGVRGPEEISKQFHDIAAQTDDLIQKANTFSSQAGRVFLSSVDHVLGTKNIKKGTDPNLAIAAGLRAEGQALKDENSASFADFFARAQSSKVGERQAGAEKIKLDLARKLNVIDKAQGKFQAQFFSPDVVDKIDPIERDKLIKESREQTTVKKAIARREADESLRSLNKKADLTESRLKMEEKIAALQHKGLAGDDLKRVRAGLEIKNLDEQIASEINPDAKRRLKLQRDQKVNETHNLFTPPKSKNPFPFGTMNSRNFESQFGFFGSTKRGIEDSLDFGGFAKRSIENGDSLTPEQALLNTGTSAADIAAYRKNVGDLPGEKEQSSSDVVAAVEKVNETMKKVWGLN